MKYVIRSNDGLIFTDCSIGENQGKEIKYNSYAEAEKVKNQLQKSFKDSRLKVEQYKNFLFFL